MTEWRFWWFIAGSTGFYSYDTPGSQGWANFMCGMATLFAISAVFQSDGKPKR